jgi:hypothetical protein
MYVCVGSVCAYIWVVAFVCVYTFYICDVLSLGVSFFCACLYGHVGICGTRTCAITMVHEESDPEGEILNSLTRREKKLLMKKLEVGSGVMFLSCGVLCVAVLIAAYASRRIVLLS